MSPSEIQLQMIALGKSKLAIIDVKTDDEALRFVSDKCPVVVYAGSAVFLSRARMFDVARLAQRVSDYGRKSNEYSVIVRYPTDYTRDQKRELVATLTAVVKAVEANTDSPVLVKCVTRRLDE